MSTSPFTKSSPIAFIQDLRVGLQEPRVGRSNELAVEKFGPKAENRKQQDGQHPSRANVESCRLEFGSHMLLTKVRLD